MSKIYITEVQAIDPLDGMLKKYAGARVKADSVDHAREILDEMGFCYAEIIGTLIEEGDYNFYHDLFLN